MCWHLLHTSMLLSCDARCCHRIFQRVLHLIHSCVLWAFYISETLQCNLFFLFFFRALQLLRGQAKESFQIGEIYFWQGHDYKIWYNSSSWTSRIDPSHFKNRLLLWLGCICWTVLLEVASKLRLDSAAYLCKNSGVYICRSDEICIFWTPFLSSVTLFVCPCNKSFNIWNVVGATV